VIERNNYATNPGYMNIDWCNFDENSAVGRKILSACKVGELCEVKAYVNVGQADNILKVISARPIGR
jgi:hypothetical protein